ncbi:unnamed protein product [Prorocentrum cordatum]|uniref:Uncharacterized protein n=1 Tax=Prorocentrum cordatum TaxID=2364126 RepID=A0ABN9TE30_9DINO|nr:unnamed protein product [Polarella glacialis]
MSDETKGGGAAEVAAAVAAEMQEMDLSNELRARCNTGAKQRIPIICIGFHQAEADFEGVRVGDLPVEKHKGMAGYTSFTQHCKDTAKGCLKEIYCRSGGEVLCGTLSHSHLAIIMRAIGAGAKWEIPTDDLAPAQVATLQLMCEAMNRPQAFSMRTSELEAMKILSSEIKNANADGSDTITYESAMQAACARLGSSPFRPLLCDFCDFILNLGADEGPHVRELIDFVETYVNSATRMLRLPAFGLAGEVSAQFPRAKVAIIMRAYRLPSRKASEQAGAPGWCIEPELAWKQRALGPQLRLMEDVLHAHHVALRTEIAKRLDNNASAVVQFLTNVNIQCHSAMAVVVKGANPSTAKASEALLQGRRAACTNAPPTEKTAELTATFQAQEDWDWLDFATLPPEEKTTATSAQEKGGGPAAQPVAIAPRAITGRPENEQATVEEGERPATWLPLPVTEWLGQAAARDMGKKEAYIGAVLQVLREKHLALCSRVEQGAESNLPVALSRRATSNKVKACTKAAVAAGKLASWPRAPKQNKAWDAIGHKDKVHVDVWAKNPEEPAKTSFYMHPEFAAPESKTSYDVEFAPKEVSIVICGRVICIRIPVATNAVDLQAGEELIMEDTHVKRKKEAAPTDWRKTAKKARAKPKSQPQQHKTAFDEKGHQDI